MANRYIGSSFEDLLKEEGTYEETTAQAIKRVLARHGCDNCGIDLDDTDPKLCPACSYLSIYGVYVNAAQAKRAREEKLTNRRWQMRFHRGEIRG